MTGGADEVFDIGAEGRVGELAIAGAEAGEGLRERPPAEAAPLPERFEDRRPEGVPPGLGAPVYAKLDAEIASALMGINAVKGVEIGEASAFPVVRCRPWRLMLSRESSPA